MISLSDRISAIPPGYSEVCWMGRKYGVTRNDFNEGKSTKVYAEELGGRDFISFNYYFSLNGDNLKPCEMPEAKVVNFLKHYRAI